MIVLHVSIIRNWGKNRAAASPPVRAPHHDLVLWQFRSRGSWGDPSAHIRDDKQASKQTMIVLTSKGVGSMCFRHPIFMQHDIWYTDI